MATKSHTKRKAKLSTAEQRSVSSLAHEMMAPDNSADLENALSDLLTPKKAPRSTPQEGQKTTAVKRMR